MCNLDGNIPGLLKHSVAEFQCSTEPHTVADPCLASMVSYNEHSRDPPYVKVLLVSGKQSNLQIRLLMKLWGASTQPMLSKNYNSSTAVLHLEAKYSHL